MQGIALTAVAIIWHSVLRDERVPGARFESGVRSRQLTGPYEDLGYKSLGQAQGKPLTGDGSGKLDCPCARLPFYVAQEYSGC
jgi:hypothetical protein